MFNAFVFTEDWWRPLRSNRPLVGRLITMVPVVLILVCVWLFFKMAELGAKTYSPQASEVARIILANTPCETIRSRQGTTGTDTVKRGDALYRVVTDYGCTVTRVEVLAKDGRKGMASMPRPECCPES